MHQLVVSDLQSDTYIIRSVMPQLSVAHLLRPPRFQRLFCGRPSATRTCAQGEEALLDRYSYTYHNPACSRFVRGRGSLPDVMSVDIRLRAVGYAIATAEPHRPRSILLNLAYQAMDDLNAG